jgi:pyridoxamine 5'-phosphate oxidase
MNPASTFGGDVAADTPVTDPFDLLDRWLMHVDPTGSEPAPDGQGTTPLMALATVGSDGFPRVRHVLLSSYDRGRLHFHTDTESRKAAELGTDPRAAVTLVWPDAARQLSVIGPVSEETGTELVSAYARRSRYLQVLAWLNGPELAQLDEADRRRIWVDFEREHPSLQPPPTWTGYALVAERIAFWRGGSDGPSQRISCQRTGASWSVGRLPG